MPDRKLLNKVFILLKSRNLTISTAESCTGGLIAHTLTNISGSSEYFDRGVISYSNAAKMQLLNISEGTLEKYGAVSKETAEEMARGVRISSGTDVGISTTGIAGPTGGTKEKPIGLVYVSVSTKEKTIVKKFNFSGDRLENKESTCNAALSLFIETLETK
ncbi:MAG: CinA family protein [Candidatus Thermoplasmatota archaeon]|nr:CinA family protein [Candidatus Thermoplasmatota archaeon]